jgi:ATP-dependent RNA helicase DDX18/HAS1
VYFLKKYVGQTDCFDKKKVSEYCVIHPIGVDALMCVIPQVEDLANFTFGENEDRKRKLVYVGVDDYEVKVRSCFFTMLLFNCLSKFFLGLFGMRNNSRMLRQPTVEGLKQGYCVIPSEERFLVLYAFLRKKQRMKQKVMVFFSSCSSVKFHSELFNFLGIECYDIHWANETAETN